MFNDIDDQYINHDYDDNIAHTKLMKKKRKRTVSVEEGLKIYGFVELIYATMLILVMMYKPEGIVGRRILLRK